MLHFTLFSALFTLWLISWNNASLYNCPDATKGDCGRCTSMNDPHIKTFDGVFYDHHEPNCYQYVTECVGANKPVPFEICACHYDCIGNSGIMCVGDVSLTFYDVTNGNTPTMGIAIDYQNALNAAVDTMNSNKGTPLTSGNQYIFDSIGNKFTYIQNSYQHNFIVEGVNSEYYAYISYSPGDLEVYLSEPYFSGNACGLCGYFDNDDGTNDLIDTSGAVTSAVNVQTQPYDADVIASINSFANSYRCKPLNAPPTPKPTTPQTTSIETAEPTEAEQPEQCCDFVQDCCKQLWDDIFQDDQWSNPIITEQEFYDDWEMGCCRDVCALTNNEIPKTCDFTSGAFDFAEQIAKNNAFKVYFVEVEG